MVLHPKKQREKTTLNRFCREISGRYFLARLAKAFDSPLGHVHLISTEAFISPESVNHIYPQMLYSCWWPKWVSRWVDCMFDARWGGTQQHVFCYPTLNFFCDFLGWWLQGFIFIIQSDVDTQYERLRTWALFVVMPFNQYSINIQSFFLHSMNKCKTMLALTATLTSFRVHHVEWGFFCLKQNWLKVGKLHVRCSPCAPKASETRWTFRREKMLKRVAKTFELCPFSNCYWNWTDRVTAVVLWPCHGYEDAAVFPPAPSGLVWCTSSSPPRNPTQVRQHLAREPMKTRLWSDITVHHSSSRSCPGRQGDSITVCVIDFLQHGGQASWPSIVFSKRVTSFS